MNYKDIFPLVLILSNTFNTCAFWGFGFLEDDKFHSHSMRVWKFHWNSCPFVPLSFSIFSHFVLASLYLIHSSDDFYWCGQITCRSDWYELGFLARFSDPDRLLNRKRERFKIFEVKSRSNRSRTVMTS